MTYFVSSKILYYFQTFRILDLKNNFRNCELLYRLEKNIIFLLHYILTKLIDSKTEI